MEMFTSRTDADKSGTIQRVRFERSHTLVVMQDNLDRLQYQIVLPALEQLLNDGFVVANLVEGARVSAFGHTQKTNPFRLYVSSVKWITVHSPPAVAFEPDCAVAA